jgi:hypothetical protein
MKKCVKEKRPRKWVDLHGLKNPSLRDTLGDVIEALNLLGWMSGGQAGGLRPTQQALKRDAARVKGDRVIWNKVRFNSERRNLRRQQGGAS